MPREEKIVIRVAPEIKEKFERQASNLGLSMSSYGASLIFKEIKNHERMEKMTETMHTDIQDTFKKLFVGDEATMKKFVDVIKSIDK